MPGNPDAHVQLTYSQTIGHRLKGNRRGQASTNTRRGTRNTGSPNTSYREIPAAGGSQLDWWPERLNLKMLAARREVANPYSADFDYAAAFLSIDLEELGRDVDKVLTTPVDWWPADYGHYGPVVLRMAWHASGTYRTLDGRGGPSAGLQRFAPLNSWPDNRNTDKAERLLWPIKRKYGRSLSWADLLMFAGTRALQCMGFTPLGFAGGRMDAWEADETYWGSEDTWFADERHQGVRDLKDPLAASTMGLIYVDPQGPDTTPDPLNSAREIRLTFARMGLNDEETVALIAGGHTFGRMHGPADPAGLGPEPEAAPLEDQGLGWKGTHGTGVGPDLVVSGLEGTWTTNPTQWDHGFLETLYGYDWEVELSPGGLWQWIPSNGEGKGTVPDAFDPDKKTAPTILTTDLALQQDAKYAVIARRFLDDHDEFAAAFARAWFKLTHIDMGPVERYLGDWVPKERMLWQDPLPPHEGEFISADDIADLKQRLLDSGLSSSRLVSTAWASASSYRDSDRRGGSDGARLRLEPQRSWEVNEPDALAEALTTLEQVRTDFNNARDGGAQVSLADVIVLGGCAAVEKAAERAGIEIDVPFRPGRTDADQESTDVEWFSHLEPKSDAFRNFLGAKEQLPAEHLMLDRAALLNLSAPQMTVLMGGLRALGVIHGESEVGVITESKDTLSNDWFVNLLDMNIRWKSVGNATSDQAGQPGELFEGRLGDAEEPTWKASRIDLVFSANAELRALTQVHACDDGSQKFVEDFVAVWDKVMELGRFAIPDLPESDRPHTNGHLGSLNGAAS